MSYKKKQPRKKDSYGFDVKDEDFSKYWDGEDELLKLSLEESKRQKRERLTKENPYAFPKKQKKDDN
tara:strand:- start:36 stop:236 length:201 start_codon:yes stop_codon:yes gene_type:complete